MLPSDLESLIALAHSDGFEVSFPNHHYRTHVADATCHRFVSRGSGQPFAAATGRGQSSTYAEALTLALTRAREATNTLEISTTTIITAGAHNLLALLNLSGATPPAEIHKVRRL